MNSEEKTVISSIFDRLRSAESQVRDPEAERFIAERVSSQPYAPYAMAQTIFVQEQALNQMNARIEELQAENARLAQAQSSGGFLSGLFGGPKAPPPPPRPATGSAMGRPMGAPMGAGASGAWSQPSQAQAGPWGQQRPGGGGFMASALTTAAGVAGGMLLANAVMGVFGNDANAQTADAGAAEAGAGEPGADHAGTDMAGDFGGDAGGDFGGDFGGEA
jgi:hypothetical protein